MQDLCLTFTAVRGNALFGEPAHPALEIRFENGCVSVRVYFDFHEQPLALQANANDGAKGKLLLRPHRLELWVEDRLCDEEWGCGNLLLEEHTPHTGDLPVALSLLSEEENGERALRKHIPTEQIRLPGVNIGDCMPFSEDESTYHLFYLYDRHHHCSKWWLGAHQWAHISTKDFRFWDEHPMAIPITHPWEGSICTGSVEKVEQTYYAWYAVRMYDRSPARLTYAFSEDGMHFSKSERFFTLPEAYEPTSARDPKLICFDGAYHLFVTTSLQKSGNGCLAHLVSDTPTMERFTDLGAVLRQNTSDQPECPDWFAMGKYYYLVYSIGGTAHYLYSLSPFSDWVRPKNDVIPCGCVPKSASRDGKRIFSGYLAERKGCYAGSVCFCVASQNPDGTLSFTELK